MRLDESRSELRDAYVAWRDRRTDGVTVVARASALLGQVVAASRAGHHDVELLDTEAEARVARAFASEDAGNDIGAQLVRLEDLDLALAHVSQRARTRGDPVGRVGLWEEVAAALQLRLSIAFSLEERLPGSNLVRRSWQLFRAVRSDALVGRADARVPAEGTLEFMCVPGERLRCCLTAADGPIAGVSTTGCDEIEGRVRAFQDSLYEAHAGPQATTGVGAVVRASTAVVELAQDMTELLVRASWSWSDGEAGTVAGRLREIAGINVIRIVPHGPLGLIPWNLVGLQAPGGPWGSQLYIELSPLPGRSRPERPSSARTAPDAGSTAPLLRRVAAGPCPVLLGHGWFDAKCPADSEIRLFRPMHATVRWSDLEEAARACSFRTPLIGLAVCDAAEHSRSLFFADLFRVVTPFQRIADAVVCASYPITELGAAAVERVVRSVQPRASAQAGLASVLGSHFEQLERATAAGRLHEYLRTSHERGFLSPADLGAINVHAGF